MIEKLVTPLEAFENLEDYSFEAHYINVGDGLNMHYLDEGDKEGQVILLLHGEPSWSYLYRKMIPVLSNAGYRVITPDLIGFGKSDKPIHQSDYTYQRHVNWTFSLVEQLGLKEIILFCQDWGGLIGLRIAAEQSERFKYIFAANTFLPTGLQPMPKAFFQWQEFVQNVPEFITGKTLQMATTTELSEEVVRAYNAPFPDERYKAGARKFPLLVPTSPDDPASPANLKAWEVLTKWDKPFITLFSDKDPITAGADKIFHSLILGTKGQEHKTIANAGHFLQEDKGEEIAQHMITIIAALG